MTSIRDRAKLYQQAAEETAKFGDLDVPLEKEWAVDTAAIDEEAIAKRAQEYEQNVKILRADQDTPGLIAKLEAGDDEALVQVDDDDDESYDDGDGDENFNSIKSPKSPKSPRSVKSPKSGTPSIAAKALEYEQSVQALLADQHTPGVLKKLQNERSKQTSFGTAGTAGISSHGSPSTRPHNVYSPRKKSSGRGSGSNIGITSPQRRIPSPMTVSPAYTGGSGSGGGDNSAASLVLSSQHDVSTTSGRTGDTLEDSFHSAGPALSLSDDDFGSITDIDDGVHSDDGKHAESVVQMEALKAGNEFTNDAMTVNDEVDVVPDSYILKKRRGERDAYPDKAPALATFADEVGGVHAARVSSAQSLSESAKSTASKRAPSNVSLSSRSYTKSTRDDDDNYNEYDIDAIDGLAKSDVDIDDIDVDFAIGEEEGLLGLGDDRGDRDRPRAGGRSRRRIVAPPRRDTGRPSGGRPRPWLPPEADSDTTGLIDPVDTVDDLSYDLDLDEDEGVRSGWARPQNDRLPKAKVVIARRRSSTHAASTGSSSVSLGTNHAQDPYGPATAPLPGTGTGNGNRRLVKQYKDRNELLAGRVSHVKIGAGGASGRVNLDREEKLRRHNAGVARRSSLVAGTIDRVSMAADPFIDFMDKQGGIVPGPKKPKGGLRKMMRKLFRRGRKNRDMLKAA